MRFCPHCGAPVVPAGKFCVECGRQLNSSSAGRIRGLPLTAAFVGVFLAILAVGLLVVYLVVPGAPPPAKLASSAQDTSVSPPDQQAGQPTAQQNPQELPPGHPKVELPAEARSFIDKVEKEAESKPKDIAAWDKLGDVTLRAAMLDASYYPKSVEAYAHSLKLNPDDPDALRGIGNLNFDHKNYDQATAAYEHYLKERPDDPEVRTDLGTMYLYTNNPDQAVVQYKRAIKLKPDFFEAYFNMGIAYGDQNDIADARQTFQQALKFAPDDDARAKVNEVMSKLPGAPASAPPPVIASAPGESAPGKKLASVAKEKSSVAAPKEKPAGTKEEAADDFHDDVEDVVRNMPFAGPKVRAVKWPDKLQATVMMNNFPIQAMPPFAKQKFLSDLKDGIKDAKSRYKITGTVVVDIADALTGEVMETVSQ
jgi:tetratricopeptide (TPR) repeat protein